MINLLIMTHCPSENTRILRDAVVKGASHPDIEGVELRARLPLEANADDVRWCNGIIIGTTENFGYMAGLIKDFFERIYYPCLEETQGLPVALYIRAGQDGQGTKQSIERIFAGLRWNQIQAPLICRGDWQDSFIEEVEKLGMTMAAGLEVGVY